MKKIFLYFLIALLPILRVNAEELKINDPSIETGNTYTFEIIAKPRNNENAVKLNILISGGTILDYLILNKDNWLAITADCPTKENFTPSSICTTLVKTDPLIDSESLGFIKIRVEDSNKLSIYKIDGNKYSNGSETRSDTGEMMPEELLTLTKTSSDNSNLYSQIESTTDPIIFYVLLGIGIVLIIILISVIYYSLRRKKNI